MYCKRNERASVEGTSGPIIYTMPKIGCRFLKFFLSMDDFSTYKEKTVSLKYARDMNWSYKDDIDCLLFFLYHWSLIYAFASLFLDC